MKSKEKVLNENTWITLAFISGNGTSLTPRQYSYTDNSAKSGKFSYRLKQIDQNGTFKYSIVINAGLEVPGSFSLRQNYPNPFNPSTVIRYAIPFESSVKISIYNSLGQCVREFNESSRQPGYYEINFNASGMASGVYFYSIKAVSSDGKNNFSAVKKMMVLK